MTDKIKRVRIGEFIEVSDETNIHDLDLPVMGLNKSKQMMPTVANLDGVKLSKYKIVRNGTFVFSGMQTGRDVCIRIILASNPTPVLVSPAYTTFKVLEDKGILSEYLFLWFDRNEADRYGWFISDSSVRSNLDWPRFLDIEIPVPFKDGKPDVERQREVVAIWQGLRRLKEDNEAIAAPLLELCQAKMDELKHSAPMVELGQYIVPLDERNSDLKVRLSQGISNLKYFQAPKQTAANSRSDRIVRTGQFAYNRATTRNGEKISIAYREGPDCTVSSAYQIFRLKNEETFLPHFLMLWFMRPEFDRYARYRSKGSAHEFFEYDEMCRVKIPKPSIEVQRAIVDIYRCARDAKAIADDAAQQLKTICPALIQHIIHT